LTVDIETKDMKMVNRGWLSACGPNSPARNVPYDLDYPPPPPTLKTFIWDHLAAMDPCAHPSHLHLHGEYVAHETGPTPHIPFAPQFSFSTSPLHYDLRPATPFNWVKDLPRDTTWEQKHDDRLLWRGRNTGIWHGGNFRWRQQQRIRMVAKSDSQEGREEVLLAGRADQRVQSREVGRKELNAALVDMAFVSEPIACEEPQCSELRKMFDFPPPMDWYTATNYKYVMDVRPTFLISNLSLIVSFAQIDGNGWSSRFKRLITSHSLIFKATGYPEWFTDRIAPWVHYVPIQLDLSDLYDTLVFFRGDERGAGAHEDLARKIALAGRQWSLKFWRKEDMTAYMYR
jgi:hypothetical protein